VGGHHYNTPNGRKGKHQIAKKPKIGVRVKDPTPEEEKGTGKGEIAQGDARNSGRAKVLRGETRNRGCYGGMLPGGNLAHSG